MDGSGGVRAREVASLHTELAAPPEAGTNSSGEETIYADETTKRLRWLGATSLPLSFPKLDLLHTTLVAMMAHHPKLRVAINHHDRGKPPPLGSRWHESKDVRISTTYIPGPRAVFWRRVITPLVSSGEVDLVWLFDGRLALHPSLFPFAQQQEALQTTHAWLSAFAL